MKRLHCPLNGLRDISEFTWLGWVTPMPDPEVSTDGAWSAYVLGGGGAREPPRLEWWLHRPSSHVFVARRDIVNDRVIETFEFAELPPELRDGSGGP